MKQAHEQHRGVTMEKQEKTSTANRYCHNCLRNFGGVCERDGHKVAQYEWCRHWEEKQLRINL